MKFAKELDQELVPEWRAKYLDYKRGKKKLKSVAKAIRNAGKTPASGSLSGRSPSVFQSQFAEFRAPVYNYINRPQSNEQLSGQDGSRRSQSFHDVPDGDASGAISALALPTPARDPTEEDGLQGEPMLPRRQGRGMTRYGSIIGSPPTDDHNFTPSQSGKAPSLRLPGPALPSQLPNSPQSSKQVHGLGLKNGNASTNGNAESPTLDRKSTRHASLMPRHVSIFQPKRVNSMPGPTSNRQRPLAQRMFSNMRHGTGTLGSPESIAMDAYKEIDVRQAEFFMFLDSELEKIEGFYKQKEDEATSRLNVLREQLHVMRDRRMEEVAQAQMAKNKHHSGVPTERQNSKRSEGDPLLSGDANHKSHIPWMKPVKNAIANTNAPHIGKQYKAMKELGTPAAPLPIDHDRQDYTRKPQHLPPYRQAKSKLKLAMAEYYRGLELLKSYAMLNRTAFRKITKKYDKTVNARPSGRYMSEKVNRAYFVNSEVVDGQLQAVEDLYARYFERGSHKIAVSKLRAKAAHAGDFTGSVFRNGVLFAIGCVFGIEGLVYGSEKLFSPDPVLATTTSYLLQIYAGYFLMLLLALLFCLDARMWTVSKVNYQFIFEFDTRHSLDWRQLAEIPCFFAFLFGLMLWLNFKMIGGQVMYIYWPVILIGISFLVLFNPFPILFHRSRSWFLYSVWRLSLAGLYPVEFRDFFLGDLFCSQTYGMGNIELFFCLYAQHPPWTMPTSCNSTHSRLLGFFTALPGIWRALHMYRFNHGYSYKAFFIFCATINAVYCSIWDVVFDWSLLDPHAKHKFLRTTLAYKSTWPYYGAMFIDPIIRFNWIFYAIYTQDVQHSTLVSFLVGLTEVCRRGIWVIFRVENEHCTNVHKFRASRDAPLPYQIASSSTTTLTSNSPQGPAAQSTEGPDVAAYQPSPAAQSAQATGTDLAGKPSPRPLDALRRRRTDTHLDSPVARAINRVGTLLHTAHAQDFERRRKPELGTTVADEDDDDDEDDETDSEHEETAPASGSVRRPRAYQSDTAGPVQSDNSDLERGPLDERRAHESIPDQVASDVLLVDGLRRASESLNKAKALP
ncbi:hypothetical protein MBLNU457_g1073t2 [Dothideomycetes sp. NU457]